MASAHAAGSGHSNLRSISPRECATTVAASARSRASRWQDAGRSGQPSASTRSRHRLGSRHFTAAVAAGGAGVTGADGNDQTRTEQ